MAEDDDKRAGEEPAGGPRSGRRPKPPLTIDLSATPVESPPQSEARAGGSSEAGAAAASSSSAASASTAPEPKPAAPPPPPGHPPPPRPSRPRPRFFTLLFAGLLGGLVALIVVIGIETAGLLPAPGRDAANAAAAKAATLAEGVTALEKRVEALEAATASLATLPDRLTALETAAHQVQPPGPAPTPASPVPDLSGRVAALESEVKTLSAKVESLAATPAVPSPGAEAASAAALAMVRDASAKGGPFADALAMLQAVGGDAPGIAALRPLAAGGAPSRADLAAAFPAVADRILAATAPTPAQGGLLDRLSGFARGLVSVRPTGPVEGTTPEAIVSRMRAEVDAGDLGKALAERDGLPEAGKAASADWAESAGKRVAIDRLVDALAPSPASGG